MILRNTNKKCTICGKKLNDIAYSQYDLDFLGDEGFFCEEHFNIYLEQKYLINYSERTETALKNIIENIKKNYQETNKENKNNVCDFCGKPSGNFNLCSKCYGFKQNGDIALCPNCGHYYPADEICLCQIKDEFVFGENTKCIICGNKSSGYLFCPQCYHKYKNKNIYLKITNCNKIELINSDYNSPFMCEDGHMVKSQQEALIDNYLFNHKIRHIYEKAFPIDNNEDHDLHPDFYLPDLDIYIEHFGIKNDPKYEEAKNYKIPFYEEAKITLICTNSEDIPNISANLERKLKFCKKGKINW